MASRKEAAVEPPEESTEDAGHKNQNRRLVALIRARLQERQLSERWFCDHTGITQVYWRAIANGGRPIVGLPKDKMSKIAELVELPVVQLYSLGGEFTAEDFVVTKNLDHQLKASWKKMQADPEWLHMAPSDDDWATAPRSVLIALIALYERVSGQDLLTSVAIEKPGATGA